jgi:hypothetical protein
MTENTSDVQTTPPAPPAPTVDSVPQTPPANVPAAEPANAQERTDLSALPEDVRKYIEDLRKESKDRRVALQKAEDQRKREEEARLAENQQYRELAELRQKELDQVKPRADRLEAIEAAMRETVQARIDALPETWRSVVPEYDDPLKTLQWLDANAAKLAAPRPPSTDAGTRGDVKPTTALSDVEMRTASLAGMTPEQYAEYKAKKREDEERRNQIPSGLNI